MLLTLPEVKQQCRMNENDNSKDLLLTLYVNAAKAFIENKTGRVLYATDSDFPSKNGWYASLESSPDLKLAMLLLVTHFHENPSATTEESLKGVPLSFYAIVQPYMVPDPTIPPE